MNGTLIGFFFYSIGANSLLHLPHEPVLLQIAKTEDPFMIAMFGTLGTIIGEFLSLLVVQKIYRFDLVQQLLVERRFFQVVMKHFLKLPFVLTIVFAFTPLPFDFIRIIVPATDYSRKRYVAAVALGRYPRYLLIAMFGSVFDIPAVVLAIMFIAMLFLITFPFFLDLNRRMKVDLSRNDNYRSRDNSGGKMSEQTREREEIDPRYRWKLERIYSSDDDWEEEYAATDSALPSLDDFRGHIHDKADNLSACLVRVEELSRKVEKLYNYAHMRLDSDSRVTKYQSMEDRAKNLFARLGQVFSFFRPEILAMDQDRLNGWIRQDKKLQGYGFYFENILRAKPHTLSPSEEKIVALAAELTMAPANIYNIATDADQQFEPVKDAGGKEYEVSHAQYYGALRNPDRNLRRDWLHSYMASFGRIKNTLAHTLASQIKVHCFEYKVANFKDSLDAALFEANLPEAVFTTLIDTVNANLAPMHRYIALREKLLKIDDKIRFYDLYVPLIKNGERSFGFDETLPILRETLAVMGEEYLGALELAMSPEQGWIDVYPNKGKRSGAYSSGCYDTVPYILMNYINNINDLSTLAHELGHSLHSYFSKKEQPYIYAEYDIFCAEVASTLNETLLINQIIDRSENPLEQLYYLDNYLSTIVKTFYYQTMYSEFELDVHRMMEQDLSPTYEEMNEIWGNCLGKYFGTSYIVDEWTRGSWMRIPHFYYNFYVFKYATSLAAAHEIYAGFHEDPSGSRAKVMTFLKSGGCDYPIEILKRAGVDMTTARPIKNTIAHFEGLLERFERLLRNQGLLP